jgi:hypothetical protein
MKNLLSWLNQTHLCVSWLLGSSWFFSLLSLPQHWHFLVSLSEFDAEVASVCVRELTCKFFHQTVKPMASSGYCPLFSSCNRRWERIDTGSRKITQICGVPWIFTHLHVWICVDGGVATLVPVRLCNCASWIILDHLGSSWIILDHLGLCNCSTWISRRFFWGVWHFVLLAFVKTWRGRAILTLDHSSSNTVPQQSLQFFNPSCKTAFQTYSPQKLCRCFLNCTSLSLNQRWANCFMASMLRLIVCSSWFPEV